MGPPDVVLAMRALERQLSLLSRLGWPNCTNPRSRSPDCTAAKGAAGCATTDDRAGASSGLAERPSSGATSRRRSGQRPGSGAACAGAPKRELEGDNWSALDR
jgi:hypothetical protein